MMVSKPKFCGMGQRIMGQHTAIESQQQLRALLCKLLHRHLAWAIAFGDAIRDMHVCIAADSLQEAQHDGSGTTRHPHHSHVMMPMGSFVDDGLGQTCGTLFHVAQRPMAAA